MTTRPARAPLLTLPLLVALATALPIGVRGQAATLDSRALGQIEAVFDDIGGSEPGCAVGVMADQQLAYARGFGMANLDYGLPITPRSNFYLGSIGKQFTAAAILHAEGAGHLSLDDPIQRWFPEIPEYERPITIRHLVHHTSGLRDYLTLSSLAGRRLDDVTTTDEVLELIARQTAPNFPAGERYLYSNTGYFLLAEIVERATGQSLSDYAEQHLLHPLGMTRTRVHDDRLEILPDRVVGYERDGDGHRMDHPWNFDQVGSGGVYSSIEDLVHWDRNYYSEEVGGRGFTDRMLERGVLEDGSQLPYAFGLTHGEYRGLRTVGHGGSLAGFRSQLLRFPEQETTVVVLCNFPRSNPGTRAERVADVVLADRLAPVVEEEEEEENEGEGEEAPSQRPGHGFRASQVVGEYHSPELGTTYRFYQSDGELMMEGPPGRSSSVTVLAPDRLRVRGMALELERQGDRVVGFTLDAGRALGIRFSRTGAG